jgi:cobyrinic acid a,c-diamide synthase
MAVTVAMSVTVAVAVTVTVAMSVTGYLSWRDRVNLAVVILAVVGPRGAALG